MQIYVNVKLEALIVRIIVFFRLFLVVTVFIAGAATGSEKLKDTEFWQSAVLPGHVILMRHALAPGTGDPSEFTIGDCSTQRNLSDTGREQAVKTGQILRQNGLSDNVDVYTSQWCRCKETARLLDLTGPTVQTALNSFFADFDKEPEQTNAALKWLEGLMEDHTGTSTQILLVTHQVNITALTGIYPASGEAVVAKFEQGRLVPVARKTF